MPKPMPSAEDFIKLEQRFKVLCRNVFSSGQGAELLDHLKRVYTDGKLYQDTDRATVYCVAQRDLIMELEHSSKGGAEENE